MISQTNPLRLGTWRCIMYGVALGVSTFVILFARFEMARPFTNISTINTL